MQPVYFQLTHVSIYLKFYTLLGGYICDKIMIGVVLAKGVLGNIYFALTYKSNTREEVKSSKND